MKRKSLIMNLILTVLIVCFSTSVYANTTDISKSKLYQPSEVANALSQYNVNSKQNSQILNDVLLPTSMNIATPNVDLDKVAKNTPIEDLDKAFYDALIDHGYSDKDIVGMTLSEYEAIEASWALSDEMIKLLKRGYPELENTDLSSWTYGQYEAFYTEKFEEDLSDRFSDEQLEELADRGILLVDTFYLFKEFHNSDDILAQSDATLKSVIEGYYQTKIDKTISSNTKDMSNYTWVDMPRYGGDYFLNDVLTTAYYRQLQADRTLRTQKELYNTTSNTLYCSNMYGTYSTSQGGAHEGIDFAYGGDIRNIYTVVRGYPITPSLSYQLAIYHVNSPDEPKTYSFVHMNSIYAVVNNYVEVGDCVGQQGNVGSSIGYHVHFEVHSGNTSSLSAGNNDVLGSISPYRLAYYIGEL